jgi:tRNA 2-selenouridine synthase
VYCFRGGKRSRLWADNLRTIGFEVDGRRCWKNYRR